MSWTRRRRSRVDPISKKSAALIITLGAAVALGGLWWWTSYTRSPRYSLGQIRSAFEEQNRLRFERYVDVSAVADQVIEAVIGQALLQSFRDDQSGWAALGAAIGAGLAEQMKPALASALRGSILEAVETGRMDSVFASAEEPVEAEGRQLNLALVGRATAADPSGFQGMTEVQREGDLATVGFQFRSEPLDTTLVIRVRMERAGKRWRVVGLDNLDDYLQDVADLQAAKLAEVNDALGARLDELVAMGQLSRRTQNVGWYDEYLRVRVPLTNVGPDTIISAVVLLTGLDATNLSDRLLVLTSDLAPGDTRNAETIVDYNRFIDWHATLRYSSALAPQLYYVVTKRGLTRDTVHRYGSWDEYVADVWSP